jgi:NitT/TauT family transport system permease protein
VSVSHGADDQLLDVRVAEAPWLYRWYLRNERLVLGLLGFVVILAIWEAVTQLGWLKYIFISSPSRITQSAMLAFRQGAVWADIGISLLEFSVGFLLAAVVGITIGLIGGWSRRASYIIDPWLSAIYATPDVALIPLIILWLGIGLPSKFFVVFLTAVFSVAVNTLIGVHSTDPRLLDVARSYRAGHAMMFRTVIIPSTIPFILTGLRLASGRALVGVVLAELIASNQGIGHLISVAGVTLNTARVMFGVILLGLFGVLLGEVMRRVERRFDAWRPSPVGDD